MKYFLPIGFVVIFFLSACDINDDKVEQIDKKGGIEVSLSTRHLDSLKDMLTTHYKVWNKGVMVREFDKNDTIPALETMTSEGENDNGDTQDIKLKKDYEFYVTVK